MGVSAFGPGGVCHTPPPPWAVNPPADTPPGRHPLPSACWYTPPAQCMLGCTHPPGQTPPAQCMLGYTPPPPSACWDTQLPCPVHTGIHPPCQCMLGYTTPLPSACWDTPPCPVHAGIHPLCQCMLGYTTSLPSACWDTPLASACWDTPPCPVHAGIHLPGQCMLGYIPPCPVHAGIHVPPAQCMLGYGQQLGSTHPTGMQSCYCPQTKFAKIVFTPVCHSFSSQGESASVHAGIADPLPRSRPPWEQTLPRSRNLLQE